MWQQATPEERAPFVALCEADKARYLAELEEYRRRKCVQRCVIPTSVLLLQACCRFHPSADRVQVTVHCRHPRDQIADEQG